MDKVSLLMIGLGVIVASCKEDSKDDTVQGPPAEVSSPSIDQENPLSFDPVYSRTFSLTNGPVTITGSCDSSIMSLVETNSNLPFSDSNCVDRNWSLEEFNPPPEGTNIRIEATTSTGEMTVIETFIGRNLVLGNGQNLNVRPGMSQGIGRVSRLTANSTQLFALDRDANRAIVWNSHPTATGELPDFVVGQDSLSNFQGGVSAERMNQPEGIHATDNTLVIADTKNNRVLVWSPIPTQSGVAANLVLGQVDFTSRSANQGGSASNSSLNDPFGVWTDDNVLYVADRSNHRVMIWNNLGTLIATSAHGAAAVGVIGQSDFTSVGAGTSLTKINAPKDVHYDATLQKLFIADSNNHRVMLYDSVAPPLADLAATNYLGQPSDSTNSANQGGLSLQSLSGPRSVHVAGGKIVVADGGNHRVLFYDPSGLTNHEAAERVIGQSDGVTGLKNGTGNDGSNPSGLNIPLEVIQGGGSLYISDTNSRILVFDLFPSSDGADARAYLQSNSFYTRASHSHEVSASRFLVKDSSRITHLEDRRFLVCDDNGNRLLLFDLDVSFNEAVAVFGKSDFSTPFNSGGGSNKSKIGFCTSVAKYGNQVLLLDKDFHRLLIWNALPVASIPDPDLVIGQSDFESVSFSTTRSTLYGPEAFLVVQGKLFIADRANNRVLFWNSIPKTNGADADGVLCQSDFVSNGIGGGATGCYNPKDLVYASNQFIVIDQLNDRVLLWDGIPNSIGQGANYVLGQIGFADSGSGLSERRLQNPGEGSGAIGSVLYVRDISNKRFLSYDLPVNADPSAMSIESDIVPATGVYAQDDFTSNISNANGLTLDLESPHMVFHTDVENNLEYYINSSFRVLIRATD